eukprot:3913499-Amphidinium_carterae.1
MPVRVVSASAARPACVAELDEVTQDAAATLAPRHCKANECSRRPVAISSSGLHCGVASATASSELSPCICC